MRELIFSDSAKRELESMDEVMRSAFLTHFEKIHARFPHNHMKYGIPCHVENVTKQARIIYDTREDQTYIVHCFTTHKEYEHWYSSYK